MKVAYLGDEYSHTFAACGVLAKGMEAVSFSTMRAVAESVTEGECDCCVLPVENSLEGAVTATADILNELPLFIRAQTALAIHHDLIGVSGASLESVKTVYSHPQALAQCEKWLRNNLPKARLVSTFSTSYALQLLKSEQEAAIARAPRQGQKVIAENVEDSRGNATRFLLLSKKCGTHGKRGSVIFGAENKPGGLLDVLKLFEKERVNMTRIESRPSKRVLGEYIFFVDYTFERQESELSLLKELSLKNIPTKYLGRYDDINRLEAETDLWD